MILRTLALAALSLPLAAAAQAQGTQGGWSLGVGYGTATDIYVGDNNPGRVLPIIRYRGERFRLGINGAAFTLYQDDAVSISALAAPRFSALSDAGSAELAGIDRKLTGDLGIELSYGITPAIRAELKLLQEVTGAHDGQEVEAAIAGGTLLGGRVPLGLRAGVSWKSEDLSAYVFGVHTDEATGTRPAYAPGETLTPFLSLTTVYPLGQQISVVGSVRAQFLPNEATNSPIVDEDISLGGFLGVTYGF